MPKQKFARSWQTANACTQIKLEHARFEGYSSSRILKLLCVALPAKNSFKFFVGTHLKIF